MKRKTAFTFLTAIAVLSCALCFSACILIRASAPIETDGMLKYRLDNGTYRVTGFEGEPSEITVPSTFNGTEVTEIFSYAFSGCTSLEKITLPESITKIGNRAFFNCENLKFISIPDAVNEINECVFEGCISLEYNIYQDALYLGNEDNPYLCLFGGNSAGMSVCTVNEKTNIVVDGAFTSCDSLTEVTLPQGLTAIGNSAFDGCRGLESLVLPDSVTSIGSYAFQGCIGLKSINIPESVASIGVYALSNTGIESITVAKENKKYHSNGNCLIETASKTIVAGFKNSVIPDDGSVTSIGSGAFYACTGLISITIPDSVTQIGSFAFNRCNKVESVTIGNGVKTIEKETFAYCSNLSSVTIGGSVTSIGSFAFYCCYGLTGITIPDSVKSFGSSAFSGCSYLTDITYEGTKAQWGGIEKGSYWDNHTANYTIHCSDGDIS